MMRSVTSQHPNGHKSPQNQVNNQNPNTYKTKNQKNAFYPRHRPRYDLENAGEEGLRQ
jgi:hypothetical protein